jgi:hypothetical protein
MVNCFVRNDSGDCRSGAAFHLGRIHDFVYADHLDHKIRGGVMFDQTMGGTLRNLAIGLVLTAAVVGAGFALAFS